MFPLAPMLNDLFGQMGEPIGTASNDTKSLYKAKINEAYRDICGMWPWSTLKSTVTLASTYLCPGNLSRICRVIDEDQQRYNFIGGINRSSPYNYNWYFADMITAPLAEGTTLEVEEYSTALTSTTEFPATTCAGEYIRIGSNPGIYKIAAWTSTSALTLSDHFRGDSLDASIFSVRPVGTQVLAFSDAAGDAIAPTDVELTYIRIPLPLYKEEDVLELPGDCAAVRIKALQKILALNKYDRAAGRLEEEFRSALSTMKAMEPKVPITQPNTLFARRATNTNVTILQNQLIGY